MKDDERLASLHLFEMMQKCPVAERVDLYKDLLALDFGFWQHEDVTRRETLRGFVIRVARTSLARASLWGARAFPFDAHDLSQDLLLAFVIETGQIGTNPRGWFIGVAIRMIYGTVRKEDTFLRAVSIDNDPGGGWGAPPTTPVKTSNRLRQLRKSINRLPIRSRLIMKAHVDGRSTADIAETLGVSQDAVRQQLCRARRMLGEIIAERYHVTIRRAA